MTGRLRKAWTEMVLPLLRRPKRVQVAALCYRQLPAGGKDVLLITSRDTGRWILPKGWPIDGKTGAQAALQEAWEEAGVEAAEIQSDPVGRFDYVKHLDTGGDAPVETQVYLAEVRALAPSYPEADERTRRWVSPSEAANMVDEPGLRDILRNF
ncbi:MAG: NUDIX hydrolase [Sedimentitalea sp.]|nr:NUDIX hydrolase [Sedimentitalea sp.]